jgi:hypothetical protein
VVLLVECQLNCAFFFFCGTGVWIQDFMVAKQMLDYLSHTPNPWTMNTWLHVGWPFLELRLKWTDTYILAHWLSRHEDNGYRFLPKASSIWFCFSDSRWLWFLSFQAWWFIFPSYLGNYPVAIIFFTRIVFCSSNLRTLSDRKVNLRLVPPLDPAQGEVDTGPARLPGSLEPWFP